MRKIERERWRFPNFFSKTNKGSQRSRTGGGRARFDASNASEISRSQVFVEKKKKKEGKKRKRKKEGRPGVGFSRGRFYPGWNGTSCENSAHVTDRHQPPAERETEKGRR